MFSSSLCLLRQPCVPQLVVQFKRLQCDALPAAGIEPASPPGIEIRGRPE